VDDQQRQRINRAAQEFTDALVAAYRTASDNTAAAQQLGARQIEHFFDAVIGNLRAQAGGTSQMARQLAGQQRLAQETTRALARLSTDNTWTSSTRVLLLPGGSFEDPEARRGGPGAHRGGRGAGRAGRGAGRAGRGDGPRRPNGPGARPRARPRRLRRAPAGAKRRATEAEKRASEAESRAEEAEKRAEQAQEQSRETERRLREAESRAEEAQGESQETRGASKKPRGAPWKPSGAGAKPSGAGAKPRAGEATKRATRRPTPQANRRALRDIEGPGAKHQSSEPVLREKKVGSSSPPTMTRTRSLAARRLRKAT
jgi:hypothetical protein